MTIELTKKEKERLQYALEMYITLRFRTKSLKDRKTKKTDKKPFEALLDKLKNYDKSNIQGPEKSGDSDN